MGKAQGAAAQQAQNEAKAANKQKQADRETELNSPAPETSGAIEEANVPTDLELQAQNWTREDFNGLTADEQKQWLSDVRGNGSEDGDGSTSTEQAGSGEGIVNRQGSVDGDAEVLATDANGKVTEAINTQGEDAGKLDPSATGDEPASSPAVAGNNGRDERLPTTGEGADAFMLDLLNRIEKLEKAFSELVKKYQTLDSEAEDLKAKVSTLERKVLNKDTLHGSTDALGKIPMSEEKR